MTLTGVGKDLGRSGSGTELTAVDSCEWEDGCVGEHDFAGQSKCNGCWWCEQETESLV